MEKAAAQKRVGQFLLVVGGNEHQRAVLGLDQLASFVAVKLHAVDFAQQVVGELDIGFVNFVNQQGHGLLGCKRLPQHAFDNVVVDVFHPLATVHIGELRVAQAAHSIVFIESLLGLGGRFDVPLQQRHVQRLGHFLGQHGFAGAGLALNQQWALQGDARIDRQHQVLGGDVVLGPVEFHG